MSSKLIEQIKARFSGSYVRTNSQSTLWAFADKSRENSVACWSSHSWTSPGRSRYTDDCLIGVDRDIASTNAVLLYHLEVTRVTLSIDADEDIRSYAVPLSNVFRMALHAYPSISIDEDVMGGAPCIANTRIPVYMVLDAIEAQESTQGVREWYPTLTDEQVKGAIGFAKFIVECPVEHETPSLAR